MNRPLEEIAESIHASSQALNETLGKATALIAEGTAMLAEVRSEFGMLGAELARVAAAVEATLKVIP